MHSQVSNPASALTASWVRTLIVWMTMEARGSQRSEPVATDERRVRADIAASRRGDGAAYARIVDRYQGVIAQRMTRFTRDPLTIEELTHDVFVDAYFSLPSYRADAPLEHWLQRIATRVVYRHWKRSAATKAVSFQENLHDQPELTTLRAVDDTAEQIATVLERLPPRDRLVLTLLYLESRSVAEAADLAGWSQTMVKVQAYRARKKFHSLFTALRASSEPRGATNE